jgi:hypothetical protein
MYVKRTQKNTHARQESLVPAAMYGLLGALAWTSQDIWAEWGAFFFLASCILWTLAVMSVWPWMVQVFTAFLEATRRPVEPTNETRIVESIERMNTHQLWLAALWMGYDIDDAAAPTEVIQTEGGDVEKSYAIGALKKAAQNGGHLESVRSYSEGTPERRNMQLLVNWLVKNDLAEPAAGNKSTRVKDIRLAREAVLR